VLPATWHKYHTPLTPGWYSIYQPRRDGRLSWRRWQVTYGDSLTTHRSKYPAVHGRESNKSDALTTQPPTDKLRFTVTKQLPIILIISEYKSIICIRRILSEHTPRRSEKLKGTLRISARHSPDMMSALSVVWASVTDLHTLSHMPQPAERHWDTEYNVTQWQFLKCSK